MSGYDKGSSRSTRDDSRDRSERERERRRSRSRSPRRRRRESPGGRGYSPDHRNKKDRERRHRRHSSSEEEVPAPPPPPRITKVSIGFTKPAAPIKMNIGGNKGASAPTQPKRSVASVFESDDDDELEEMPAEAKMRMRNIGRETPTSAGPNSFGKTKQGFCDSKKVFEKNLNAAAADTDGNQPRHGSKFPQTIYKIKPQ